MPVWCLVPLALVLACTPPPAPPPAPWQWGGHIQGRVIDDQGQPISGAHVLVDDGPLHATSDAQGLFSLGGLSAGDKRLVVRHDRFEAVALPARVQAGATLSLTFRLSPLVEVLPPEPESPAQPPEPPLENLWEEALD